MRTNWQMSLAVAAVMAIAAPAFAASLQGVVTDDGGTPLGGAMVSAIDADLEKSVTVFTNEKGEYEIKGLEGKVHSVRARLYGKEDTISADVDVTSGKAVALAMKPVADINSQRTGDDLFSLVKWDSEEDKSNFKMQCAYCHQIGTIGFRSPEEPVDWETMVARMQGFGGLFEHTKTSLVKRLLEAYDTPAMEDWPEWEIPAAPSGKATDVIISEWDMGREHNAMIHDLEPSMHDGLIYTVDMIADAVSTVDPKTGERKVYTVTGGKEYEADGFPTKGPHSLEPDSKGNMWITLALSGQMAKFDAKTKEFTIVSSAPAPRKRGMYPHTLRVDQNDVVWYTDAGTNSVFSLDPSNDNVVKEYKLLSAGQAIGSGKGESSGITPYGISVAPDGKIWYSKLNGNRIGRIDPTKEDGDIKEWVPPYEGPRRLHVAKDGKVWVPFFGDGNFGSFDPATEAWECFDMPRGQNEIPYALNIHPQTGDIWVCGTGSDTLVRFEPDTQEMTEYRMPSQVTYTREVEFTDDGSVWVCNSNYPARHTESGRGSVLRVKIASKDADAPLSGD